jgi:hypothetical protein
MPCKGHTDGLSVYTVPEFSNQIHWSDLQISPFTFPPNKTLMATLNQGALASFDIYVLLGILSHYACISSKLGICFSEYPPTSTFSSDCSEI